MYAVITGRVFSHYSQIAQEANSVFAGTTARASEHGLSSGICWGKCVFFIFLKISEALTNCVNELLTGLLYLLQH